MIPDSVKKLKHRRFYQMASQNAMNLRCAALGPSPLILSANCDHSEKT